MCIYDHFKGQYRHTRIADAYITSTKPTNQNKKFLFMHTAYK